MILDPAALSLADRQHYLQSAIAPRPICFASTISKKGEVNLSPFSFFNLFSIQPPVVIFSPSRRARNNTIKHTLENLREVPELVIQMVDYPMIHQTSLSSCEYPREVNEFRKAGFTEEPATLVRPPMVKESKFKMECRVMEIKALGQDAGAGNLVICEILRLHIAEDILDAKKRIDPYKLSLVARLGGDWYCRVDQTNLFAVEKPHVALGIGIDNLPQAIRSSNILTGNHLGQLANIQEIPSVDPAYDDERLRHIFQYYAHAPEEMEKELQRHAAALLDSGRVSDAWQVLLAVIG